MHQFEVFTVVERVNAPGTPTHWLVLDDLGGMERYRGPRFQEALRFAMLLTYEAQEVARERAQRRQEITFNEAPSFVGESYAKGQRDAYAHAQNRLSFLLGGTLPRGGAAFRRELAELSTYLARRASECEKHAEATATQREARIQAKIDALDYRGA